MSLKASSLASIPALRWQLGQPQTGFGHLGWGREELDTENPHGKSTRKITGVRPPHSIPGVGLDFLFWKVGRHQGRSKGFKKTTLRSDEKVKFYKLASNLTLLLWKNPNPRGGGADSIPAHHDQHQPSSHSSAQGRLVGVFFSC